MAKRNSKGSPTNGTPAPTPGPTPGPVANGHPSVARHMTDNELGRKRIEDMVANLTTLSRTAFQQLLDPRRNLNNECGYPDTVADPLVWQELFTWDSIANRVIEVYPKECFQVLPDVYEDEDSENVTEFEAAWDAVGQGLRGDSSYYDGQGVNPIWEYMLRADILSGVGQYGVILLGLDDGQTDLSQPVKGMVEKNSAPVTRGPDKKMVPVEGADPNANRRLYEFTVNAEEIKGRKLKYVRCFPEMLAQITQFESNISSPRFGQPVMYLLTFNDPSQQATGVGLPIASVNVHWTRVIHVADNLTSSEVFGVPRCKPVLRNILALQKVYGGSAEGYWRSCFPAVVLSTHPQLGGDVEVDRTAIREMMEKYWNGLDRSLTLTGMGATTLPPTMIDPTPTIGVHIEAICIKLGIPDRVFRGSERGELASSQDDAAWNDRIKFRQKNYITPRIIVPFIDRLIAVGVLPQPSVRAKQFNPAAVKLEAPAAPAGGGGGPGAKGPPKPPTGNAAGQLDRGGNPKPVTGLPRPEDEESVYPAWEAEGEDQAGEEGEDAATGQPGAKEGDQPRQAADAPAYRVEWPDITSQTEAEKADVASKVTTALAGYVSGGVEQLVPPMDFLTRVMDWTEEEAQATLQNAEQASLEKEQADMEKQQALIDQGLIADPAEKQAAEIEMMKKGVDPNAAKIPPGTPGASPFPPKAKPGIEPPIKPPLEEPEE